MLNGYAQLIFSNTSSRQAMDRCNRPTQLRKLLTPTLEHRYLRDNTVTDKSKRSRELDRSGTLASFRGTVIGSKTYVMFERKNVNSNRSTMKTNKNVTRSISKDTRLSNTDVLKYYEYLNSRFALEHIALEHRYSRGIRQLWAKMFRDDTEVKIHVVNPDHETEPNYKWAYYNDMSTSEFCLAPPGWASWTPRVFEALALSCIPVIVTDGNRLPFESRTRYQDIALFVPEKDASNVKRILKSISKKKIDTMRSRIRAVSDRFLYTGTRGDAFDYLMMDLRDRASSLLSSSIN